MRTVISNNGCKVTFHDSDLAGYRFKDHHTESSCLEMKDGTLIPVDPSELAKVIRL